MPASARRVEVVADFNERDQIVLDAHAGHALAALRSLIANVELLCDQLETDSLRAGSGLARSGKMNPGVAHRD